MAPLRQLLARVPAARSLYYLSHAVRQAVRDSPANARAELDRWYAGQQDPWHYATEAPERERYEIALNLVDSESTASLPRALELGCGEGLFTRELAARCSAVTALDVSTVALERAAARCRDLPHVRFAQWDARSEPLSGSYDLVVCMDVVDDLLRPWVQRRAIRRARGAVAPDGRLLVSAVIQHPVVEKARWGRWMGRGGIHIVDSFARHPRVVGRTVRVTETHAVAILRIAGRR